MEKLGIQLHEGHACFPPAAESCGEMTDTTKQHLPSCSQLLSRFNLGEVLMFPPHERLFKCDAGSSARKEEFVQCSVVLACL